MKCTKETVGGDFSAVRWFLRFADDDRSTLHPKELLEWARWSAAPGHFEEFRRVKEVWRGLGFVVPGVTRPTDAEIQADAYDASIPISQWVTQTPMG